jgi:tetratricopeptide (TPR) repeat protein
MKSLMILLCLIWSTVSFADELLTAEEKNRMERIDPFQSPYRINELQERLANNISDTGRIKHLIWLAYSIRHVDVEEGISIAKEAYSLAQSLDSNVLQLVKWQAWSTAILAKNSIYVGDIEESASLGHDVLQLAGKLNDTVLLCAAHTILAYVKYEQQNYKEAIELNSQAREMAIKADLGWRRAVLSNSLWWNHFLLEEYDQGRPLLMEAQKLAYYWKDSLLIAAVINNLGHEYMRMNDYDSALIYLFNSLELKLKLNLNRGIVWVLQDIGLAYQGKENHERAIESFKASIDTAIKYNVRPLLATSLDYLTNSYVALGDHEEALATRYKYEDVKKSITSAEVSASIAQIESRFEQEQKLAEEEKARTAAVAKTERRNYLQYLVIFIGLSILLVVVFLITKTKRDNRFIPYLLLFAILLAFEFVLVVMDPFIESFTGGIPIEKLMINTGMAVGFVMVHTLLEKNIFSGRSSIK